MATAGRYGYFRDELYFIACSHHLAWGYVDQPPLVAVAAFLSRPFAYALPALRAPPAFAAAATVALAVELARVLGGGTFARWTAGLITLFLPAYLLLGNTLTTTSFEPLSWMLVAYCAVRLIRSHGSPLWWIAASLALAFGLYGKYSIGILAAALVLGILTTPQRHVLASPWLAGATGLVALLVLPNVLWQSAHAWPMLEVLRGDAAHRPAFQNGIALESRNLAVNALSFAAEQFVYANVLAAPVWIAGIIEPFLRTQLKDVRFFPIATVLAIAFAIVTGGKGYYVVGIYGPLVAIGAVSVERLPALLRGALLAGAIAAAIVALPFSLPVLPVDSLVSYSKTLHVTGNGGSQPHLVQAVFAEEFGWDRLARDVASVYRTLPRERRLTAAVYADTYGDAGALDFFGPQYALPPVISSQNTYYLWGTHGASGTTLIAVGATRIDVLRRYYRSVRLARTSFDPRKWVVEGPAPIYVCEDPVAPLSRIWPHLRWYGA